MPDESVRQDFLGEIQLMKAVGPHKNIVSMVGCCTLEEPMFLLVEYAPYGDLLHYLRKHRKTVFIPLNTYMYTLLYSVPNQGISEVQTNAFYNCLKTS